MHLGPCNGNLIIQSSQILKIGLIRHDIQIRFPQSSNCQDLFRQGLNQQFRSG